MKLFSPAKINLFLAVTGRRPDGFHSLVSLVVPLEFGDDLEIEEVEGSEDRLLCEVPGIPLDGENLILKAAEQFRKATGVNRYFEFVLEKRIPAGGGFGGGSSNAVCALRGMNEICGGPLDSGQLYQLAENLGSDCPLFLADGPVVMRGRGEKIEAVPDLLPTLRSWRVYLFNPGFFSSTADLFQQMAGSGRYSPEKSAEEAISGLIGEIQGGGAELPLQNDLGSLLAEKYLFYDTLFCLLRKSGVRDCGITGSGCGAFALIRSESEREKIVKLAKRFLDDNGFMIETRFSGNNYR